MIRVFGCLLGLFLFLDVAERGFEGEGCLLRGDLMLVASFFIC
jgi:hypothetical protein